MRGELSVDARRVNERAVSSRGVVCRRLSIARRVGIDRPLQRARRVIQDDPLSARLWIWQGIIVALAVVSLACAWMTRFCDPGIVVPSDADDEASARVDRLDEAIREKIAGRRPGGRRQTKRRRRRAGELRACVEEAVREDEEARSMGMRRDYAGTWTKPMRRAEKDTENADGAKAPSVKFLRLSVVATARGDALLDVQRVRATIRSSLRRARELRGRIQSPMVFGFV